MRNDVRLGGELRVLMVIARFFGMTVEEVFHVGETVEKTVC